MKDFFALIGIAICVAGLAGALIYGYNCHIVIGSDQTALKFHKEQALKLERKLEYSNGTGTTRT